jgi:hypothetical protein
VFARFRLLARPVTAQIYTEGDDGSSCGFVTPWTYYKAEGIATPSRTALATLPAPAGH